MYRPQPSFFQIARSKRVCINSYLGVAEHSLLRVEFHARLRGEQIPQKRARRQGNIENNEHAVLRKHDSAGDNQRRERGRPNEGRGEERRQTGGQVQPFRPLRSERGHAVCVTPHVTAGQRKRSARHVCALDFSPSPASNRCQTQNDFYPKHHTALAHPCTKEKTSSTFGLNCQVCKPSTIFRASRLCDITQFRNRNKKRVPDRGNLFPRAPHSRGGEVITSRFFKASGLPSVITTSAAREQAANPSPANPDMPAPSSSTRHPATDEASGLPNNKGRGSK